MLHKLFFVLIVLWIVIWLSYAVKNGFGEDTQFTGALERGALVMWLA